MADISMCMEDKCPKFNKCYRAQAQPNTLCQSYTAFTYDENGCNDFIPMNGTDNDQHIQTLRIIRYR